MPGISSGRNNPNDYVLGRGVVYFSPHNATNDPLIYRDLGNCTAFSIAMENEELDHLSSRLGLKVVDRSVLISQKATLTLTLDELNLDNLALWMSGTTATVTGYNGVAVTTPGNISGPSANPAALVGGKWYDLFKDNLTPWPTPPFEDRVYDIGVVTFTVTAPAVTVVEGTDYIVDYKMGRLFIVDGGLADGATAYTIVLATNASAGASYDEARMFTQTPLRGSLKFIQVNPANQDELREWQFHRVQLKPSGSMDLIGEDWASMELTGAAEKNSDASGLSSYCTVRTFPRALGPVLD